MPTVVLDTTRLDDAEATTGWHILDTSSKPTLNPDFVYQNANSISRKVGKTSIDGVEYDPASGAVDFSTTPKTWIAKIICATPGLLETTSANGLSLRIGSDETAYHLYYIAINTTYPATKSWLIIPIDPNLVGFRDTTTGSPTLTAIDYFAVQAQMTATSLGENVAMDAVDYVDVGEGSLLTGTAGSFEDFRVDDEDDLTNGRAGIISSLEDVLFIVGMLRIGDANQVGFSDSNKTLIFIAGVTNTGFCGYDINVTHASSDVDFTSITSTGRGIASTKKFFDTALQVTGGATDTVTLLSHDYTTGDYVLYSDEGGVDTIGLTDATNYWVFVVDASTIALHATRASALADTTRVGLTAASAPGENHSFLREPDNRADLTVTGTSGAFDTTACTFDTFNTITLTSACTITGGFILATGVIVASTGAMVGVSISTQTTEEGAALFEPITTLANLDNCTFTAGAEGHIARLTSTGTTSLDNATITGYWNPTLNGWNFDTITGVDDVGEVITTDAAHGFTTGDAIFYNDGGGTDTIGLTDLAKYYANVLSTTTLSVHETRAAAVADSSRVGLTDGSTGETHSLYSGNAAVFNDSGGAVTIDVLNSGDSPSIRNGSGATTTVNNAVTIKVTGVTEGTRVSMHQVSDDTELLNALAFTSDGEGGFQGSASFNYLSDTAVTIRARNSGRATGAIADDNGSFTDETINANSNTTNDMNLLPTTPVVNEDRYIIGHTEQFAQLRMNVGTAGTGGFTITWQYWNGAWTNLSGVSDGTSSFSVTGENVVSWTLPGDWVTSTINSQGPYYYIRAAYTAGSVTITPLGRRVTLDVTRYEPFTQTGTIISTGLSVKAVWVEDTVAQF